MNHFLEWQVFPVKLNIIYQDNTISINMEDNGKESLRKRTRNLDKLFNVTVLVGLKEVNIQSCPTDEMVTGYMTKPLVGKKIKFFRDLIMNLSVKHHRILKQDCFG